MGYRIQMLLLLCALGLAATGCGVFKATGGLDADGGSDADGGPGATGVSCTWDQSNWDECDWVQ